MKKDECLKFFGVDDIMNLPNAVEKVIFLPTEDRDEIYKEFMKLNSYDIGRDWFQQVYEEEFSQRKKSGQDFTPVEVTELCAVLAGVASANNVHEPTAGTGQMIISAWWMWAKSKTPWECFPSRFPVTVWELLDRTIPFLLFNLSIRGIMGYVYNGDTLENTIKKKYILLNRKDDALGFSDIIVDETLNMTIKGLPETTRKTDNKNVFFADIEKKEEKEQTGPRQLSIFEQNTINL